MTMDFTVAEVLQRPTVAAPLLLTAVYVIYQLFLKPSNLPQLPILNARPGEWFPLLRARWRNSKNFKAACLQAHRQYPNQACIVPVIGAGNMVLLPAKDTKFVIDQPNDVLSLHEAVMDSLQTQHTFESRLIAEPLHHHVVTTTLTNQTGNLVPALAEETALSLDEVCGTDTTWHDVRIFKALQKSIGRVANRVFLGLPLCRDPELVRLGIAYAQDIPYSSTLLRLFPGFARPLVAPFITLPNKIHERGYLKIVLPTVERRLHETAERRRDPEKQKHAERAPNDFLQWLVEQALDYVEAGGDRYHAQANTLARRIMAVNFASIHTSSFTITSAILDLAATEPQHVEALREEIRTVLAAHGGKWDKKALAQMLLLDSTMRESARLNSFVTVGLGRRVVAKDGLVTPDGVHIPKGNQVCVPSYAVHHDPEVYDNPEQFNPFRFSDLRRSVEGENEADKKAKFLARARQQWATTTTEYLAFGHGREACPGRFFATVELKLMFAYLILNYDFEKLEVKPKNTWIGIQRVPPMEKTVRMRRRKA